MAITQVEIVPKHYDKTTMIYKKCRVERRVAILIILLNEKTIRSMEQRRINLPYLRFSVTFSMFFFRGPKVSTVAQPHTVTIKYWCITYFLLINIILIIYKRQKNVMFGPAGVNPEPGPDRLKMKMGLRDEN